MSIPVHLVGDFVLLHVQATVVLGVLLLLVAVLRRVSPRLRHTMLAFGLLGLALLPLQQLLPTRWIAIDLAWTAADIAAPPEVVARGANDTGGSDWSGVALWVGALGVLGTGVFAVRVAVLWLGARSLIRSSTPVDARVARLGAQLGAFTRACVRASARIETPIVVGVVCSTILLPERASTWSDAQIEAVLRHEIAHTRHRDPLWLWIGELGAIVYWMHPLYWLVRARLRLEAELAADDAVLRDNMGPSTYANILLDLARTLRRRPIEAWATGAARPSQLRRRVVHILAQRRRDLPSPWLLATMAAGSLAAVLCCALVYLDRHDALGQGVTALASSRDPVIVVGIPGSSFGGVDPHRFRLGASKVPVDLPQLRMWLCAAGKVDAQTAVNIWADATASHLEVVAVMDAAKQCGLRRLGILHGQG